MYTSCIIHHSFTTAECWKEWTLQFRPNNSPGSGGRERRGFDTDHLWVRIKRRLDFKNVCETLSERQWKGWRSWKQNLINIHDKRSERGTQLSILPLLTSKCEEVFATGHFGTMSENNDDSFHVMVVYDDVGWSCSDLLLVNKSCLLFYFLGYRGWLEPVFRLFY